MGGFAALSQEAFASAPNQNAFWKVDGASKSTSMGLDSLGSFLTSLKFVIPNCLHTISFGNFEEKFNLIDSVRARTDMEMKLLLQFL